MQRLHQSYLLRLLGFVTLGMALLSISKTYENMLCLFFQSLAFSSMKPNREQADQGEMQSVKSQPHKAKYRMVSFEPRGQSLTTITSKPM